MTCLLLVETLVLVRAKEADYITLPLQAVDRMNMEEKSNRQSAVSGRISVYTFYYCETAVPRVRSAWVPPIFCIAFSSFLGN